MENPDNTYCRLCAELKTAEKLLSLADDDSKYNEIALKLSFLNATYIDVTDRDIFPKFVCLVCYESLNNAYNFLDRVKKAQDVLSSLFNQNTKFNFDEDDALSSFDFEFLSQDEEVKRETPIEVPLQVKIELKDEPDTPNLLQESLNNAQETDNFNQLNVQELLDAALCNGPFTSNLTIYAKELTDISKKDIRCWKDYPWVCTYCNIEFLDIDTLRSHGKSVHGKCSAFVCVDCKVFGKNDDFNSFLKHVRKHRKCLKYHCHYCDEVISDRNMGAHVKQHFTKTQVSCTACGEILKSEEALQKHFAEYMAVKPKRKPRRKAGTPLTVEDLTCTICKNIYKNPNSLRDHLKRHTTDRKRNYTCDRCGKMFYNKGTLTSHIMSHDQIRPHLCRICNKSFLFPNMLRRHVDMHSGVKPFACDQCGRRFRLQYQLNAHKIVHTDSMPYGCQYCRKRFRFKQILKNHERQHTGAKPYMCQHCGMEFSNWSNYNKHMKRRHNTDTSKKKITPEGCFPINPETGMIIQLHDQGTEEWKSKIMIPAKRGKKKAIKEETVGT